MSATQGAGLLAQARALLGRTQAANGSETPTREALACELAELLLSLSERHKTPRDREQAQVLRRMIEDPRGQVFTTLLTDRAYRSRSPKRTVEQARYLLQRLGSPAYLGTFDKLSLGALQRVGTWLPSLSGTAMLSQIQHETRAFILPAAAEELDEYLRSRKRLGVAVNINHLGEEVLDEKEAERRVAGYVELLERPEIDAISVKVSSIYSQLQPLAFETTVERVTERLRVIHRAALEKGPASGTGKLVTLDMESYRDLDLTLTAFERVLDEEGFESLTAGVVLQAYLPDSEHCQLRLLAWAKRRVQQGKAPIRVRLVKGANLAMERVESELKGWTNPIHPSKALVDAQFKRLLLRACRPENIACCRLGIASHNLFDIAFGLITAQREGVPDHVAFELLEGMANPLVLALRELGANVLVYAPVVGQGEFPSAIAYLVRRLDENTSAENYLGQSFGMQLGSTAWQRERARFLAACEMVEEVPTTPRRTQNRSLPPHQPPQDAPFANEPDTDFVLAENRRYVTSWLERVRDQQYRVESSLGGTKTVPGFDPSRPGHVPYTVTLGDADAVEKALVTAVRAHHHHRYPAEQRRDWLRASAQALRAARGELIALMVLDAGKRVEEADVEVSEAIDFAEYYLRLQHQLERTEGVGARARGVVVVTPPWNFPLAIALSGVFAALVAGNAVILKPALETPLVAQRACELLWDAGVPQDLLQFVVCEDAVGSRLIADPRTSAVVLTGATQTARLFYGLRPDLLLFAETGGKNALFVSAMSDHEQAIVDVLASAFGHAGQKCSALSQLVLERELYEDPAFLRTLADATSSLKVGSAWELDSFVTPLIQPPSELQREALTALSPGESWLVQPRFDPHNPRLVSPGIKLGVEPSSRTHLTEFFCPLLGVLCANDVSHAVQIANSTRYGLTAGIHSLDEREQAHFIEHIEAGNVYVNRKITGAIVRRQPFGGWKESGFGPGAKAGGPNYVAQFVELTAAPLAAAEVDLELALPTGVDRLLFRSSDFIDVQQFQLTAHEYVRTHTQWFASATDETGLQGEDNLFRYRPLRGLFIWVDEEMQPLDLALIVLGAEVTQCPVSLYVGPAGPARDLALALGAKEVESEAELAEALQETPSERLRCVEPLSGQLLHIARQLGLYVISGTPLAAPRFELLHTLREQSVSVSYHRYGHMGLRGLHSEQPRS